MLFIGWHYLSNATCPIRPYLFYTLFTVSRIITIYKSICHFLKKTCVRQVALDKWLPLVARPLRSGHGAPPSEAADSAGGRAGEVVSASD